MSTFRDMLKSGESLFRDTIALDYDFQPKILPYREHEQRQFAVAIRPLLEGRNGKNLFIYGPPGIGKTTACRHVLRELEEETEDVVALFVNCWKENTTYKIFMSIANQLGFKFIQNKNTGELFTLIKKSLNKRSAVFVFDEVDKLEEMDFLYTILEDIYRKSIFMISNYRDLYSEVDERIRSRLAPEFLYFRPYTQNEVAGILRNRMEFAFVPGCWDEDALQEVIEKCSETKDVRIGLYLMKEAGNVAEEKNSTKITAQHVGVASRKVEDFHIKPKDALGDDLQGILQLVQESSGSKIGDVFSQYQEKGGTLSYKSFQRRIAKLDEAKYINTEKVHSKDGNTTLLHYASHKKLTDF